MKPAAEQMTLFDFPEVIQSPEITKTPALERKTLIKCESRPLDFDSIKIGLVCEIIAEDPRKEMLPRLYTESQLGRRVIVTELCESEGTRWVWAYVAKPHRYRTNRNGSRVCEYDPSCMTSPYKVEWLQLLDNETSKLTMELIK
ncbi:hypothetical protein ACE6ED_13240 [Paenibacillus sp. CN-4]|uniref:hypothetical protein n=1 Tax=Paenibacillus nanchangensis TaxID=3348343 RepID=UPI003979F807